MPMQYLTDENGRRVAVQIPIDERESLQAHIEYANDVTDEEIAEAQAVWEEYLEAPGKAKSIEQVMREQLEERED